jgi:hypothetical protein
VLILSNELFCVVVVDILCNYGRNKDISPNSPFREEISTQLRSVGSRKSTAVGDFRILLSCRDLESEIWYQKWSKKANVEIIYFFLYWGLNKFRPKGSGSF